MKLDIKLDVTGFPMIYASGVYVQWLPVTKIQLEYFLSATNDAIFDESWYYKINQLNQRISPAQIRGNNYWQTLVTGILPREGIRYATWCGRGYELPTAKEWLDIYEDLDRVDYDKEHLRQVLQTEGLRERPKTLIERIARAMPETSGMDSKLKLADQMMLRQGITEYVFKDDDRNTFVGLGLTNPTFVGGFRRPTDPQTLTNPNEGTRMRDFGFRLIYRGT